MAVLSDVNRVLKQIPKRAEQRHVETLRDSFVDSGVGDALDTIDHQILYGRRGTGKTHALRYLESIREAEGDLAVYVDLYTMGSSETLFAGTAVDEIERAARLYVDLMSHIHQSISSTVADDPEMAEDTHLFNQLNDLADAVSRVRIVGDVETSQEGERKVGQKSTIGVSAKLTPSSANLAINSSDSSEYGEKESEKVTRKGSERRALNVAEIAKALREIAGSLKDRRIWLLLDEWISIPPEVQPYVGELIIRTLGRTKGYTLKIAAIEQQSRFRQLQPEGNYIGIELGADVAANLDLDDFMVFEQNEEESRNFFRKLILNHLSAGSKEKKLDLEIPSEEKLISTCFTEKRAFNELVRAAEGVPRDALNVLGTAASLAGSKKISVPNIRKSAQNWYQQDKAKALAASTDALALLHWVIDDVIKGKKARGFLVNQKDEASPLLMALFDARVLHLIRRGYSSQHISSERYNVYVIDYGAYVDLMQTKSAPLGLFPSIDEQNPETPTYVDVPPQDLRSLRRAVVDFDDFDRRN